MEIRDFVPVPTYIRYVENGVLIIFQLRQNFFVTMVNTLWLDQEASTMWSPVATLHDGGVNRALCASPSLERLPCKISKGPICPGLQFTA